MRISDWSSDVCSSDLINSLAGGGAERVMATLLHASAEWRDRYDISLALLDREDAAYAPPRWVDTIQFDFRGRLPPSVWANRRLVYRLQPQDRKRGGWGKGCGGSVDLGGCRFYKTKKKR